ncbi:MAG: hypothetical protein N2444_05325 [Methylocystis sp.]|nr:hypothetical protein [Methylocystis sp.]
MRAGDWRTLETFWNVTTTAFFRLPPGAKIKIRYGGGGIFGRDRQVQTLDGVAIKRLSIGGWSALAARIKIKVQTSADVTYDVEPGDVAIDGVPVHI